MLTPHQLREAMMRDYARNYRRAGVDMSSSDLERLVIHDCELADKVTPAAPQPKRAKAERPKTKRADVAAAQAGVRLAPSGQTVRTRALDANPMLTGPRWAAAVRRIEAILENVGRSSDLTVAARGGEHGALALEFAEVWSYFQTRDKAPPRGIDHNPFRGLKDGVAARAFIRKVEDICDRSTGRLGPWWVR